MAINRIVLQLASEECGLCGNASLFQTEIQREEHPEPLICIRGKTAGAYRGAGTFQWTRAVHGITLLLLLHKLQGAHAPLQRAIILGDRDSLASSLDYAISKRPTWLCEMFGTTGTGDVFANRLFKRSNPNRKRPGPVVIAVNENLLSSNAITVYLDGKLCDEGTMKKLVTQIAELDRLDGEALAA